MSINRRPSRKPSGPPTYAPTTRPVYRGGSSSSAAYPLSFSALGMTGASGFVFDSLRSAVLQSVDGAPSANGDVVGYIEDVSGSGSHVSQNTTANKPTVAVTNGIAALRLDASKFLEGTMPVAINNNAWSMVLVGYNSDGAGSVYVAFAGSANYFLYDNARYRVIANSAGVIDQTIGQPRLNIVRVRSNTGGITMNLYNANTGALDKGPYTAAAATGTTDAVVRLGISDSQRPCEFPFVMVTNYDIDDTLFDTIKTKLVERFGGWR
ncbi:MAG: hypothetical protein ACLGH6_01975 [Gammaproteobacteria bacterium]